LGVALLACIAKFPRNPKSACTVQLYVPDLFLQRGFPSLYESVLRLPVIRSIRRQEHATLRRAFFQNLRPSDDILEIGSGTGYYTFEIAALVHSVVALERSAGMAAILKEKIVSRDAQNISTFESDFLAFSPDRKFDAVIAIGVLDSVVEWRPFLDRCVLLAKRRIILTIPRSSLWASIHSFFGGMVGVRISVYDPREFAHHLRGQRLTLQETGLQTRWTHGLTFVAVIETDDK
jgi:SAM-dependent methyltransferase